MTLYISSYNQLLFVELLQPFTLLDSPLPLKVNSPLILSVWMKSNFPSKKSEAKLRPIVVNR